MIIIILDNISILCYNISRRTHKTAAVASHGKSNFLQLAFPNLPCRVKGGDTMTITLEELYYIVSIVCLILAFVYSNKK